MPRRKSNPEKRRWDSSTADDKYQIIESNIRELHIQLKQINSQNQVIVQRLKALENQLGELSLQLLQTLKGLASLKGEDYTPSSPSEQAVIDAIKQKGLRVINPNKIT